MNEKKYIRRFRRIALASASVLFLLIAVAWIRESFLLEWKLYQWEYRDLVRKENPDGIANLLPAGRIYEVSPRGLRRTDRCITCHLGIGNPVMKEAPQPHTLHPGGYLEHHPVDRFGCTVCHGGQGRAVEKVSAFGEDPSTHWNFPLLHNPYIQSSCGKCHLGIFTEDQLLEGTGTFRHGKEVFSREGCLGCHRARGLGGIIGPDLTSQGEKTKHEYSFTNIRGEQTVSNWLKEHFRDPEMVSPGSDMLSLKLPEEELEALVTFTMGLAMPDISYQYLGVEALQEFQGKRNILSPDKAYAMICSSCHGKEGEGKGYLAYKTGVPSLGNYDFVRTTPEETIEFTITHGRGRKQMASWLPQYSGLTGMEIDSLVRMIAGRFSPPLTYRESARIEGRIGKGREIYRSDCAMCHGEEGHGDIGLPICNTDFLATASDRFLFETIFTGRKSAGMPAWMHYSAQDMADLLGFIRTWGAGPREDRGINLPAGDPAKGDLQYHYLCSRCHGEFGEGNTGPAILNPEFQEPVSDRFLFLTISYGRSHTAMFGWSVDVQGAGRLGPRDVSDIIAYMRRASEAGRDYIYPGSNPGNATGGKELFRMHCAECHGENGQGVSAPALNNQEFLGSVTNGYLMATISLGREGTRMPSWGRGSDEHPLLGTDQRKDLAAHIRFWQRYRIRK